jgi:hypothetical protein
MSFDLEGFGSESKTKWERDEVPLEAVDMGFQ